MANLEVLKKSRKAERAAFTKVYNKVEKLIVLQGVDISELEMESELSVLKSKVDCLEITHVSILPETEFDLESEIIEDYRDKGIRIESKARRIIDSAQNVSAIRNLTPSESAILSPVKNAIIEKKKV